ncbi:MAG TPA: GNAT family N-acetyltransferase [Streptosporangiaceae bacterium]|nr:GNAT family N-acetyltransferase [Streptosporangiaceae bacterium]
MPWTLTRSLDTFAETVGDLLGADPVRHTVPLTLLAVLRATGASAISDEPARYGWHAGDSGQVDGAFFQTPPFPLSVTALPAGSASALIRLLAEDGGLPDAANVSSDDAAAFSAAWVGATGGGTTVAQRQRLHRLGRLVPPDPAPPGAARVAGPDDRELLVEWSTAFDREAHTRARDNERTVDDRLSHAGLTLWESGGQPVAMAGRTRDAAGVVRVAGVYTPPAHRQRGYGAGVTAAVTQAALDAGASAVVLFTDLANPTSNAIYQRLGYRQVEDRVLLDLHLPG